MTNLAVPFAIGYYWAGQRKVQSQNARFRAGASVALAPNNPVVGIVLANEMINAAKKAESSTSGSSSDGGSSDGGAKDGADGVYTIPPGTDGPTGGDVRRSVMDAAGEVALTARTMRESGNVSVTSVNLEDSVQELVAGAAATVIRAAEAVEGAAQAQAESARTAMAMFSSQSPRPKSRSSRSSRSSDSTIE